MRTAVEQGMADAWVDMNATSKKLDAGEMTAGVVASAPLGRALLVNALPAVRIGYCEVVSTVYPQPVVTTDLIAESRTGDDSNWT